MNKLAKKFDLVKDETDHLMYDICLKGIFITKIRNSNAPKDYQDQLMANDLHISRTQLQKFVECTFSNDDLIYTLKKKSAWPSKL